MAQDDGKSTLRDQIDANLRRAYDATVNEPVPDRLTDLLEQLRAQQGGGTDGRGR